MADLINSKELQGLKETLSKNFNDLKITHVMKLGEGWMSRAYLINQTYVFRFPKEKSGACDTEKEIKALPTLKKMVTLDIPEFVYFGKQTNGFPFVGYEILPGNPMNEQLFHSLEIEVKQRIAQKVAEFIDQMNSFNTDLADGLKIPVEDFYSYYLNFFLEVQEKIFPIINRELQDYISSRFRSYLENKDCFIYRPTLLHSDLSLNHFLFDKNKQEITGIIDFGDLRIGDPVYEYIYLLEECGEAFTREVMQVRKETDIQYKLQKLSFFLFADNLLYFVEGLKRNNLAMVEEAKKMLHDEMVNQ